MALTEEFKDALIAEACGTGPAVPGLLTFDLRTRKVYLPGQWPPKPKRKLDRAKRASRKKMAKASRKKKNRRK